MLQVSANPDNTTTQATLVDLNDGQWHMLTLTSHTPLAPGYQMYLDGALAAEITAGQEYRSKLVHVDLPESRPAVLWGDVLDAMLALPSALSCLPPEIQRA